MTKRKSTTTALFISLGDAAGAPEWIMLVPAGTLSTVDGRGPYKVADPERVATLSMQADARLPVDENHATDLAAIHGNAAPARGWIVAMEVRDGAIWGQVEWTEAGRALLTDRAYRHISPVLRHDAALNILRVERASLTNTPNLRGMVALNTKGADMDFMRNLRKALGLADEADEAAVLQAVEGRGSVALQSALNPIAQAAGLEAGADATAILGRVETLRESAEAAAKGGVDPATVTALQSELTATARELDGLKTDRAKEKATAFVDGAIAAGHVGVKPMRDHYIARHMKEPGDVEKEISALPKVQPGTSAIDPTPPDDKGGLALNSAEQDVCTLLGLPQDDFKKTRDAEQAA